MIYVDYSAKVHSKGFHDINAVVSLPFPCFMLLSSASNLISQKRKIAQYKRAVEHKLTVLSSQNVLEVFSKLIKKKKTPEKSSFVRHNKLFSSHKKIK
jgi:hypothetical protein